MPKLARGEVDYQYKYRLIDAAHRPWTPISNLSLAGRPRLVVAPTYRFITLKLHRESSVSVAADETLNDRTCTIGREVGLTLPYPRRDPCFVALQSAERLNSSIVRAACSFVACISQAYSAVTSRTGTSSATSAFSRDTEASGKLPFPMRSRDPYTTQWCLSPISQHNRLPHPVAPPAIPLANSATDSTTRKAKVITKPSNMPKQMLYCLCTN